jgi:plastocyanin
MTMKNLLLVSALITLASPAWAKEYTVKMITDADAPQAYRFEPAQLSIRPGDTVTFVDAQDDMHDVMFEAIPKGATFARSPMLEYKSQTWSYTFPKEGTYTFHCHPHEALGMKGVITVGKPSHPADMQTEGRAHHHDHVEMPGRKDMDHAGMGDMQGMDHMAMQGFYGAYPMTRESSGTAWMPEASPMEGLHGMYGDWMTMVHGYANFIYDHQGGKRGEDQTFSESMLMAMASRPLGSGTFGVRTMLSLDPAMGKSGYPLLLQTGETADGTTHLVDRQHPHDLFMELAATYSLPVGEDSSAFGYVGYPGEPALGPATFMHRFSGMDNPEAPISHHWLDSTHITFGVVTLGYVWHDWKIEASAFNGREPDQFRWNFDAPRLSSYAARVSNNPTVNWSLQVSHGSIKSPEALTPEVDQHRTTASATYNLPFNDNNWQTTLAWGLNNNSPGHATNAVLLESALTLHDTHTFFGRAEYVGKDELFESPSPLAEDVINVGKLSVGYIYDIPIAEHLKLGLGGLGSVYALPDRLDPFYGENPASAMLFARIKLRLNMDSRELSTLPLVRRTLLAPSTCSIWLQGRYWCHDTHTISYRRRQMF